MIDVLLVFGADYSCDVIIEYEQNPGLEEKDPLSAAHDQQCVESRRTHKWAVMCLDVGAG